MAQNVFQMHRMRNGAQYENLQGLQQDAILRGVSIHSIVHSNTLTVAIKPFLLRICQV